MTEKISKILSISIESIFDNGRNYFNGFLTNYFFSLDPFHEATIRNKLLHEKLAAERDCSRKQIIPYIIVRNEHGQVLTYRRKNGVGDPRLQEKYSIGVGGHIEEDDVEFSLEETILKCTLREVREELGIPDGMKDSEISDLLCIEGYVNDDSNEVGRMHFGIVILFNITNEIAELINIPAEEALELAGFKGTKELEDLLQDGANFEDWSKIIIPALNRIHNA